MIFYAVTDFVTQYSMYKKCGEMELVVDENKANENKPKQEVDEQIIDETDKSLKE